MLNKLQNGKPFKDTVTHATAAAITIAAVANKRHFVTDVEASSDKAGAILTIKAGSTVIFQIQVGATHYSKTFSVPLDSALGGTIVVEIDGTSACKANVQGVTK